MGKTKHYPVLLKETISLLKPRRGSVFIDATCGFGGHAAEIFRRIGKDGKLLCIDQDPEAISSVTSFLSRAVIVRANFKDLRRIATQQGFLQADGILADIGVSSPQLDEPERGFSFLRPGPLDMRMNKNSSLTAEEIINRYGRQELKTIFQKYGEEKLANAIAKEIISVRSQPIKSTEELATIISRVYRQKGIFPKTNPATKVFQALRIAVNDELQNLEKFLPQALEVLKPGGRLAVITFHSLEDRIVKGFFKTQLKGCTCPPQFPICRCGRQSTLKLINKKPLMAAPEEILTNPRSRSAKLRVIEKL